MEFGQEAGVHVSPLLGKVPDRRCPKLPVSVPVALLRQQRCRWWLSGSREVTWASRRTVLPPGRKVLSEKSCFHVCSQAPQHAWFIFGGNNVRRICANCWQQRARPSDADRETMFGDCSHAKLKMTLIKQS